MHRLLHPLTDPVRTTDERVHLLPTHETRSGLRLGSHHDHHLGNVDHFLRGSSDAGEGADGEADEHSEQDLLDIHFLHLSLPCEITISRLRDSCTRLCVFLTRSEQLIACHDEQVSGLRVRSFIDEDGYNLLVCGGTFVPPF